MKTCRDCGVERDDSAFYRYPNGWLNSYCKPCHNARTKRWRDANPEKTRQAASKSAQVSKVYRLEWRRDRRARILSMMGGKCVRCGFDDPRALQIDHIDGGGHAERLELGSAPKLYTKLLRDGFDGYQLLCANCNWIKRYENGEYRNNYREKA